MKLTIHHMLQSREALSDKSEETLCVDILKDMAATTLHNKCYMTQELFFKWK